MCFSEEIGSMTRSTPGVPSYLMPMKDDEVHMCTLCNQINLWNRLQSCDEDEEDCFKFQNI